jgi:hypothetical protein
MKRVTILTGILVLVLSLTYAQASTFYPVFSFAKARAGHDKDWDRYLAEAADGPWEASARSSSMSLGGFSSFMPESDSDVARGKAYSASIFYQPFVATRSGTQSIAFKYSGLLEIGFDDDDPLHDELKPSVGYMLAAFDDHHNKYFQKESLEEVDKIEVEDTFKFVYQLDQGEEVRLLFLLMTFAKLGVNGSLDGLDDLDDLKLLADFNNSFDIVELDGLVVIPIPSTVLLLGTALMGLVGLRRRIR